MAFKLNRIFEYKRGITFYVKVVFNETAGTTTMHDAKYPSGTPHDVKQAFLEEAEEATMRKIMAMGDDLVSEKDWQNIWPGYGGDY